MHSELKYDQGIPGRTLLMMSAVSGLTVANLYYNQPLIEIISRELGCGETLGNLVTVATQAGYAAGLLLVVPMADMWPRRRIVTAAMAVAAVMALVISFSSNIFILLAASLGLGTCSVIPQIFIPAASRFSKPENKSRNIGYILSGMLTGILAARAISGFVGTFAGWRAMFMIASALIIICMILVLKALPQMDRTFSGSYRSLLESVWKIFISSPRIRACSFRGACSFASMMSIWSCMAFHIAGEPFHAGSNAVGILGLCGAVGAAAAGGIGKYAAKAGLPRMSATGVVLQAAAWACAFFFAETYAGLAAAIVMLDLGAQCQQISNQNECLQAIPEASSRANTIFMSSLFVAGSISTFLSAVGWRFLGWDGVCLAGLLFAVAPIFALRSASRRHNSD